MRWTAFLVACATVFPAAAEPVRNAYVDAFKFASFNPSVRQKAFLDGLDDGRSLEEMARDGVISGPYDCIPELRVECFDAVDRVKNGTSEETVIYEWGEWADGLDDAQQLEMIKALSAESVFRGFNLLSDDEMANR